MRTGCNPKKQKREKAELDQALRDKKQLQLVKGVFCNTLVHSFFCERF